MSLLVLICVAFVYVRRSQTLTMRSMSRLTAAGKARNGYALLVFGLVLKLPFATSRQITTNLLSPPE
jgi:hypothetical protein